MLCPELPLTNRWSARRDDMLSPGVRGAQLLEEKLGVDVEILESVGGTGVYERTGSGLADANMEVWALGKEEHYNT